MPTGLLFLASGGASATPGNRISRRLPRRAGGGWPSTLEIRRTQEQGFTLIEVIAVLVLLGVLAAVVVPRYMAIVADARNRAANQAVAEGAARVGAASAKFILDNGASPANYAALAANAAANALLATAAGDYTLAYANGGTDAAGNRRISITASGGAGTNAAGSTITGFAYLP